MKSICKNFLLGACSEYAKRQTRLARAEMQIDLINTFCEPYYKTIYDIGAAGGFFMAVAQGRGWFVDGNEISKAGIEWARENMGVDISYGFLDEVTFKYPKYDAVVMWNTLEHTIDPAETIRICDGMIEEGGVILVEVPTKREKDITDHYEDGHSWEFNCYNLKFFMDTLDYTCEYDKEFYKKSCGHYSVFLFKKNKNTISAITPDVRCEQKGI